MIVRLMMIVIATVIEEGYVSSSNLRCLVLRTCCRRLEMSSYLVYIGVSLFGLVA